MVTLHDIICRFYYFEVYKTDEGRGGIDEITFPEVDARYVRMFGTELGWWFGYSLWSFDVLGGTQPSEG